MIGIEVLLEERFFKRFGKKPEAVAWAPGRVNLIGEHIDYNGGCVLPVAIDKRIYAAASASENDTVTLLSGNLKDETVFRLSSVKPSGHWGDYIKGVVAKLIEKECPIGGFDALLIGDLPIGAGVSSSAAVEVVACYLLQKLFRFSILPREAALLCQQAEHEFAGTQCGIMDQFVSVMGVADTALFLNCRNLEHGLVPFTLGDYLLVACDSRVERGLAASEYNRRRKECEQGLEALSGRFPDVHTLCDATLSQLNECDDILPAHVFSRCRHVVTENARVLASVEALAGNDLEKFGELMNRSHVSLRDDYEVSCPELDFLVETALDIDGVLGSRLTGAGFGGSTISLMRRSAIDEFERRISEGYLEAFDIAPRLFECIPSDGAERARSD